MLKAKTRLKSVEIELDTDYGIYLNFKKLNLSEEAIENISTSNFSMLIEFPEFDKSITYSFLPNYNNVKHTTSQDQGSILIDNVDKYETEKEYPLSIHFQIESNNIELKSLFLLRNTNSINGTILFDISSYDVDFFNGEYLKPQYDERFLEFEYLPNGLKFKFLITKS